MRRILHPLFLLIICLGLAACIPPRINQRGHVDSFNNMDNIRPGVTTRAQVREMLGSPSITNNYGEEIWYYASERKEAIAFMEADVADQQVTRIIFDKNSIVRTIDGYGMEDVQQVAISDDTTPTEGDSLGFFEQILGNVGRFNGDGGVMPGGLGGRSASTSGRGRGL